MSFMERLAMFVGAIIAVLYVLWMLVSPESEPEVAVSRKKSKARVV